MTLREDAKNDRRCGKYPPALISLLLLVLLALDQVSKVYVDGHFDGLRRLEIIPSFFYISKLYNRGAAFSLLATRDWGGYLLAGISLLASVFFIAILYRVRNRVCAWLMLLISAGTLGNGIDRLLRGVVVDFLEFHFGSYVFPSFNLADSFLVLSCTLLILLLLFRADLLREGFRETRLASFLEPQKPSPLAGTPLSPEPDEREDVQEAVGEGGVSPSNKEKRGV